MKINYLTKILGITCLITSPFPFISCKSNKNCKIIKDYLVELPTYKSLDYQYAQDYFKTEPIQAGACSAVAKDVGNNHLIVGRNMDYAFSKKCAYIVRTNEPDKYKTLGFAYATNKNSPDFSYVKSNGINKTWKKIVPFFCTDVINDQGLYCEIDMRNIERDNQGKSKFRCDGTNKSCGVDVHMVALTRFIVNNCKDVNEAINFVQNNINVFNNENDWNFSFILADASGNCGLLEFANNKIYWNPTIHYQTNYFLSPGGGDLPDLTQESKNKFGYGRVKFIENNLDNVTNASTMFNLIDALSYSNVYKGRYCTFDMRTEASDLLTSFSFEDLLSEDPEIKENVYKAIDVILAELNSKTEEEKKKLPWYWQSTFTEVVDVINKSIHIRMFENNDYVFDFKLD